MFCSGQAQFHSTGLISTHALSSSALLGALVTKPGDHRQLELLEVALQEPRVLLACRVDSAPCSFWLLKREIGQPKCCGEGGVATGFDVKQGAFLNAC